MIIQLGSSASPPGPLAQAAAVMPGSVDEALHRAQQLGAARPSPGDGSTRDLWECLATLAVADLTVARAVEPHLDAVAILTQAGVYEIPGSWGVFAAEGGDEPLAVDDHGRLTGSKLWCSLADRLDHALVTVTSDGSSRLFSVELRQAGRLAPGVHVRAGDWHARGLAEIPSGTVRFDKVAAREVGEPDWYLRRPGFAWGGIGVAACWYGGAVGVARAVYRRAQTHPDPHLLAHLGAIDEQLESARRALLEAATIADSDPPTSPRLLAARIRATVHRAAEETLWRSGHALGPAPLALDADHAKRVADLQLYLRQDHAERDLEALGAQLADRDLPW